EVLERILAQLTMAFASLERGASVLDDPRFARELHDALNPLAFCTEITAKGAKLRAYCDINATVAVFDMLVRVIAKMLSLGEIEVATRIAAAAGSGREAFVAAGRRLFDAGRYDEAAACARRALDLMSACPL